MYIFFLGGGGGGWERKVVYYLWVDQKKSSWCMRSSRVVSASGCPCQNRNSPESDPFIPRHSGIWLYEWREMKQCWLSYIKKEKNPKKNPLINLKKDIWAVGYRKRDRFRRCSRLPSAVTLNSKHVAGSLKMNTALEYSTRVVQEGGRRCKKSTLNDLVHHTPLRIPLMNPPMVYMFKLLLSLTTTFRFGFHNLARHWLPFWRLFSSTQRTIGFVLSIDREIAC